MGESCRSLIACCEIEIQGERERKERAAAADSCCGRSMNTNPASAAQPSDPGSTGPKWAAEEQHWVPLFNTIPEVPTLVSSHVPRNSCARLRQRMSRRQCQERDVARCLESLNWLAVRRDRSLEYEGTKPGATRVLLKQEVQASSEAGTRTVQSSLRDPSSPSCLSRVAGISFGVRAR